MFLLQWLIDWLIDFLVDRANATVLLILLFLLLKNAQNSTWNTGGNVRGFSTTARITGLEGVSQVKTPDIIILGWTLADLD